MGSAVPAGLFWFVWDLGEGDWELQLAPRRASSRTGFLGHFHVHIGIAPGLGWAGLLTLDS